MSNEAPELLIHDKVIQHLYSKLGGYRHPKVLPALIWVMISIASFLIFTILAISTGEVQTKTNGILFLNLNYLNSIFIGLPALSVCYYLFPVYLDECISSLKANKVIGAYKKKSKKERKLDFDKFKNNASKQLSSKSWIFFSLTLSAIFMIIALPQHKNYQGWVPQHLFSFIIVESLWFISFAMAALLGFRMILGVLLLNQIFRKYFLVYKPVFRDAALSPLRKLAVRLAVILLLLGVQLAGNQFSTAYDRAGNSRMIDSLWTPGIAIAWFIYLCAGPLLFFLPIQVAHNGMKDAKEQFLQTLSDKFHSHYDKLDQDDPSSFGEDIDSINKISRTYEIVSSFPTWPFQNIDVIKFFGTYLIPIIAPILPLIIGNLFKK